MKRPQKTKNHNEPGDLQDVFIRGEKLPLFALYLKPILDDTLSYDARGVYARLMADPETCEGTGDHESSPDWEECLEELVQAGYLTRQENPDDTRTYHVVSCG